MKWKKYLAIIIIIIMLAANSGYHTYTFTVNAAEEDSTQNNASESASGGESDSASSTSGSESASSGSEGDSSGEQGDSSGGESESSGDSGTSDSSGDSSGQNSSEDKNSSKSSTSDSKAEDSTEDKTSEDSDEKTNSKTATKKTVVEDDSNGRDYQESENISSGNLTFTIVSVSRDTPEIDKKIKELQKKQKNLKKQKKALLPLMERSQNETYAVEEIYAMIRDQKEGVDNINFYLMGYDRSASYSVNENKVIGLDRALSKLAKDFHNTDLSWWLERYSTELQPMAIQTVQSSESEDSQSSFSNVAPLLKTMEDKSKKKTKKYLKKMKEIKEELADVKSHIKTLKEKKEENTVNLDSRLEEYKNEIPDQTVDFLNAVVAKEGCPYVWGADGPSSFDCSGLVSYGLRQCGAVSSGFRWTSFDFVSQLKEISFDEAKPGDLVWKSGHIAIYIDENTVFEAPYTGANVRFTSCNVSSRFRKVLRWWSEN